MSLNRLPAAQHGPEAGRWSVVGGFWCRPAGNALERRERQFGWQADTCTLGNTPLHTPLPLPAYRSAGGTPTLPDRAGSCSGSNLHARQRGGEGAGCAEAAARPFSQPASSTGSLYIVQYNVRCPATCAALPALCRLQSCLPACLPCAACPVPPAILPACLPTWHRSLQQLLQLHHKPGSQVPVGPQHRHQALPRQVAVCRLQRPPRVQHVHHI